MHADDSARPQWRRSVYPPTAQLHGNPSVGGGVLRELDIGCLVAIGFGLILFGFPGLVMELLDHSEKAEGRRPLRKQVGPIGRRILGSKLFYRFLGVTFVIGAAAAWMLDFYERHFK